jgi:phosphoribosylformylglycinamidine cyclo-ligase
MWRDGCLTGEFSYSDAGVDRELRARSKRALRVLRKTYDYSRHGKIVELPYSNVFPVHEGYLDLAIEGVGTKVLVAQLAEKYDTIGVDGVAVVVNDVIRSGARPIAVADNIHAQVSEPALIEELMKGIVKGATEAECIVPAGEIGDVSELIRGLVQDKGFDLVFASVGEVARERVIRGDRLKPGDTVIGMRSSGLHSNGISLARKILFKQWGGKYEPNAVPDGIGREIIDEVLEPTRIYVKPLLKTTQELNLKAAVHITGDAYLKFMKLAKFSPGIGFEFDHFEPQPIFALIKDTASELGGLITDEEMFKTFNMGWGFAVITDKAESSNALDVLDASGVQAEEIGRVSGSGGVRVHYRDKKIILS